MLFNTMYNIVDTFYAGLLSTQAVAALSYSFMLFFMILAVSFGFNSALLALIGNSLGKHKIKLAKLYSMNGVSFLLLTSLILTFLGFVSLDFILELIGADTDIKNLAKEYMYVILIGVAPMLISLGSNAILISKGDTKSYRNILIIGFFLNLILNPLFIYGFNMGLSGIALATTLIQFISMIYIVYKVNKIGFIDFRTLRYFIPRLKIFKDILTQGIPSSINMLTMGIGALITTRFVSEYGFKSVAGFGIGFRVQQILLLPALGINSAILSIVSNNFGAKQYDRVKEAISKALKYGYTIGAIALVLFIVFGKMVVSIFDSNPTVIDVGYNYVIIEALTFFGYVSIFIAVSTLQAIKKPFIIPYVSFYRQIFMKILLFWFVVYYFKLDIEYMWWAIFFIIYTAAIFLFWYTKKELNKYYK